MSETCKPPSSKLLVVNEEPKQGNFPPWLHRKLLKGKELFSTAALVDKYRLNTVCEEAKCPNRIECYSKKTATFLALGKECTRNCGFCDIDFTKTPKAPEADEPERIALSVKELGLAHAVITMVARDDLPDGGALHMVNVVKTVRFYNPGVTVELLTSDFAGNLEHLDLVLSSLPEVFNHNLETVERLSPKVRHKAEYQRSLTLLTHAKKANKARFIKSGLMVGLGETKEEISLSLQDLHRAGCDIVTIGQYLRPSRHKLLVKEFIPPEVFQEYANQATEIGIPYVYSAPFVRSSYNADLFINN